MASKFDQAEWDKWQKAELLYQEDVRCIRANMDDRDIPCSSYQSMRIDAIKQSGLGDHTAHCKYRKCMDNCPSKNKNK